VSRVDDLAPDEQALLRLILQQGRSYADLARLLKTSPDVVRERAHLGLQHVVGCDDLDDRERAAVADYVLGQQDQAGQERARDILRSSPAANHWALMLVLATAAVVARPRAIPSLADEPLPATPERVRPNRSRPAIPRSSRTGGAILLGVCAVLVVVTVKIVTGGHDQQPAGTASASAGAAATASPSATATPSYQAVGQVQLSPPGGGKARGALALYAAQGSSQLAFQIEGAGLAPNRKHEAYGLWLQGRGASHFLGFAPTVTKNGQLGASGPQAKDAANLSSWLAGTRQVLVTRETTQHPTRPGGAVLTGDMSKFETVATATPTPTP
jgi:hypothetical protein